MFDFWLLWEILINAAEYYFFFFMLSRKLGYKGKYRNHTILGLIILIFAQTSLNFVGLNFQIAMLIMLALDLIYVYFLFCGTVAMRIIWGSCGIIVLLIANLLTSIILTSISAIAIQDTLSPSLSRIGATLLYVSLCIILFLVLSKIPNATISLPHNLQILIISIVVVGTVLASQIVAFALEEPFSGFEHTLLIALSASLLFMLFAIIFLVHKIGSVIQKEAEAKNKLQSMCLEQQNQERLTEVMRTWNHDQHHFINVLSSYVAKKDLDGISAYLREMNANLEFVTSSVNTSNPVIDGMISVKLRICQSENIPLRVVAKDLADFPLGKAQTGCLLGNLLDNAIEACKKLDDAKSVYIELKIAKNRGMYTITLTNSSNGEYQYVDGELVTSKKDDGHGIGLTRIRQIVEDAGGFYKITALKDRFRIEICLPIIDGLENGT